MNDRDQLDHALPVPEAIAKLLLAVLPVELRVSAADLADCIADHPEVTPLVRKLWGELTAAQGDAIEREVNIVATDVIFGAAGASTAGQRLH